VAIVAKENNQKLSDLLGVNDEYASFCLNELGLYLATVWRNEKPYKQKVMEQNRGLMAKADKLKRNTEKLKKDK
jgi:hypothetical protein